MGINLPIIVSLGSYCLRVETKTLELSLIFEVFILLSCLLFYASASSLPLPLILLLHQFLCFSLLSSSLPVSIHSSLFFFFIAIFTQSVGNRVGGGWSSWVRQNCLRRDENKSPFLPILIALLPRVSTAPGASKRAV